MHLLSINPPFPAVHNNVVELQVVQALRIEAQVQVHKAPIQRGALQITIILRFEKEGKLFFVTFGSPSFEFGSAWNKRHRPQKCGHMDRMLTLYLLNSLMTELGPLWHSLVELP